MSTFIQTIGGVSVCGIDFDIYENEDGTATVRQTSHGEHFPRQHWIKFKSVEAAEARIKALVKFGWRPIHPERIAN